MNLKKVLQKNSTYIVVPAMLTLISALLTVLFYVPVFITNDDLLIQSIASGTYTGKPSAYLVYVMFPLGILFKTFYTVLPTVKWYEIITFGMHFVCLFLICVRLDRAFFANDEDFRNRFSRKKDSIGTGVEAWFRLIIVCSFYLIVFGMHLKFIVENQYTILAGLMASTAFFYYASSGNGESRREFTVNAVVCVVMFTLSLWLRKEVCFMILPLFFSVLAVRVITGIISRIKLKRILVLSGILLLILVSSVFVHKAAYRSPEWKEFEAFNKARTDVYDYSLMPGYPDNTEFYKELGIRQDEYTALLEYSLNLTESANTSNFEKMAEKQRQINKEMQRYISLPKAVIKDTLRSLGVILRSFTGIVTVVFAISVFFAALRVALYRKKFAPIVIYAGLILYFIVFTAYFTFLNRLPERVYIPLLYAMSAGFFSVYVNTLPDIGLSLFDGRNVRKTGVFLTLAGAVVILFTSFRSTGYDREYYRDKSLVFDEINEYVKNRPDDVFLVTSSVNATQCRALFKGEEETTNYVRAVDWCYNSPLMKEKYKLLGIDNTADSLRKENVYLLTADYIDPQYVVNLVNREGEVTEAVLADTIVSGGNVTNVWKFRVP